MVKWPVALSCDVCGKTTSGLAYGGPRPNELPTYLTIPPLGFPAPPYLLVEVPEGWHTGVRHVDDAIVVLCSDECRVASN